MMATFCALHDVEAKEKGEMMAVEGHTKALKVVNPVGLSTRDITHVPFNLQLKRIHYLNP